MSNSDHQSTVCFVYSFLESPRGGIGQYELQLSKRLKDCIPLNLCFLRPVNLAPHIPKVFGIDLQSYLQNNPIWFDMPASRNVIIHLSHQFMGIAIPLMKIRALASRSRSKIIITVHDLYDLETHWNPLLNHLKPNWRWSDKLSSFFMIKSIGLADRIIVDSQTTKETLLTILPHVQNKISVIYLGWNGPLKNIGSIKRKSNQVLYVGSLHPRKNILTLIKAITILRKQGRDVTLTIAGASRTTNIPDEIRNVDGVEFTGELHLEDIGKLYATSSIFAFPSLSEGFGLPLLEAMGYGCPVVASDIPIFRELAGDAAMFVSLPQDEVQWANMIGGLLSNEQERNILSQKGNERSALFTWEKTFAATLAIYRLMDQNN